MNGFNTAMANNEAKSVDTVAVRESQNSAMPWNSIEPRSDTAQPRRSNGTTNNAIIFILWL